MIGDLKTRQRQHENLFESDFTRVMAAILPHYFVYDQGWVIAPEIWSDDKRRSDFVVSVVNTLRHGRIPYGHSIPKVMVEGKAPSAIPWSKLCKDQLWDQADSLKNDDGKLWVIGQIGYYVCIFRFDVLNYRESEWFRNFSPLNLHRFSPEDLDELEIKHITESVDNNTRDVTMVIQWDLRQEDQYKYIHEMLSYIVTNNA